MLNEKSQTQKTTDFRIPFVCEISRLGIYRDGKQICGCQGIAEEGLGRDWEGLFKEGYKVST